MIKAFVVKNIQLCVLATLLLSQPRYPTEVAIVEDISPGVALQRAGKSIKLQLLSVLLAGDRLTVSDKRGRIVIRSGKELKSICSLESDASECTIRLAVGGSYTVKGIARTTLTTGIAKWLSDWLNSGQENLRLEDASVRHGESDPPIRIPMLARPDSRLGIGHKRFYLGWVGGRPPYTVHLRSMRSHGKELYLTASESRIAVDTELDPDNYAIDVAESGGSSVQRRFRVVRDPAPSPPQIAMAGDKELVRIFQVSWLASQQDGVWMLEAYHQASLLRSFAPGEVLFKLLELGPAPKPPPAEN